MKVNRPVLIRRRLQPQERPRLYKLFNEFTGLSDGERVMTRRQASDENYSLFKMGHRKFVWLVATRFNADGTLRTDITNAEIAADA